MKHPLDALLPEICQLLDTCREDFMQRGLWTEWDQSVRDRITAYNLARSTGSGAVVHNDHPLRHYDRTCPACNSDGVATDGALSPHAAALDVETVLERLDFIAGHEASAILRDTAEAAADQLRAASLRLLDALDRLDHGSREPGFRGWENGYGEPCGDEVEDARQALAALVREVTT